MEPLPAWIVALPPLVSLLVLALLVDLVERFLELTGRILCGWERVPEGKSRDLWVLAALLALALSVLGLGLGSIFALGLVLILIDLFSTREGTKEEGGPRGSS